MPQIFRVYQNNLAEIQDLINKEGWDCHIKAVVHIQASIYDKAELAVQHFDSCYKPVCEIVADDLTHCLLYTSPSPRDGLLSRMPSSA